MRTGEEWGGSSGTGFDEMGKSKWRWMGIELSANGLITSYVIRNQIKYQPTLRLATVSQ